MAARQRALCPATSLDRVREVEHVAQLGCVQIGYIEEVAAR
jgi:hypothetical protein